MQESTDLTERNWVAILSCVPTPHAINKKDAAQASSAQGQHFTLMMRCPAMFLLPVFLLTRAHHLDFSTCRLEQLDLVHTLGTV